MTYEFVITETPEDGIGLVRINRPKALNALSKAVVDEIVDALKSFDQDPGIGCMIVTGDERAFAAGADIKEMVDKTAVEMYLEPSITTGLDFSAIHKPIIAAVSGYALGGGNELAMMCDMIVASETAVFGQPEITLGILPGAGGTQRLTRMVGKALAMEIMLANRQLTADEAYQFGLVNKVCAREYYMDEALNLARKIAGMSQVAVALTKDAINKAYETSLEEGLAYEQRNFLVAFGTEDKAEGMQAFIEKRKAQWKNR